MAEEHGRQSVSQRDALLESIGAEAASGPVMMVPGEGRPYGQLWEWSAAVGGHTGCM